MVHLLLCGTWLKVRARRRRAGFKRHDHDTGLKGQSWVVKRVRNGLGMAAAGMGEGERLIGMSRKERKVRVRAKALNDVVLSKKKLIFFIYIN